MLVGPSLAGLAEVRQVLEDEQPWKIEQEIKYEIIN